MAESRSSKKEDGKPSISDAFNLQGRDINFSHVNIGCTTSDGDNKFRVSGAGKSGDEKTKPTSIVNAKEITIEIQRNLIHRYENIKLPVASWMTGVDLKMENYTRLELQSGNEERNRAIELQNLFDKVKHKRSRRILIESQPGFGKTTLTHKIITDWVNYKTVYSSVGVIRRPNLWFKNKNYIGQFEFAVLIILRHFKSTTLEEYLAEITAVEDCDAKNLWRVMNNKNTLLILDGLDEIGDAQTDYIYNILHDPTNKYKMTIAVTCRCGLSRSPETGVNKLYDGVASKRDFWKKKITILGLSENSRDEFLSKFIVEHDKDRMLHRLHSIINLREQMFTSPLLLILLVYVTRENHEVNVKTETALYKSFVDYLIRRSAKCDSENLVENFSIFDSCVKHVYKTLFYEFGELALNHVLNEDLHFKHDSLTERIYKFGFLLKHETVQQFDSIIHYEGFHLSIVEFAVAFFFAEEFKKNKDQFVEKLINKIYEIFVKKGQSTRVIPFLCGLLGRDVAHFFDQIKISYWINPQLTENILQECETNNLHSECFSHLVPPYLIVNDKASMSLVQHQCISQNLTDLHIQSTYLWDVQFPLSLNILKVDLTCTAVREIEIIEQIARKITCKTLIFALTEFLHYTMLEYYLLLFDCISSEYKALNIYKNDRIYSELEKCVTRGTFTGRDLDHVTFELGSLYQTKIWVKIIECSRLKRICIHFNYYPKFEHELVSAAIESKYVIAIIVYSDYVFTFNFNTIVDSEKIWNLITIENAHYLCNSPINNDTRVKTLALNSRSSPWQFGDEFNALLSVNPIRFHCVFETLHAFSIFERASHWGGWNSVVKLQLVIEDLDTIPETKDFSSIFKFLRLKVICIDVTNLLDETKLLNVIRYLKSLNLDRLEIRWFYEHNFDNFIRRLQSEIPFFKTFRFSVLLDDILGRQWRFNVQSLTCIFQHNSALSVRLIFKRWDDARQFVVENFTDLSRFNLKYFYVEDDFKHPLVWHENDFDTRVYWNYFVLEMTMRPGS